MLNIRTHVIICLTLGIVIWIAMLLSFQPISSILTDQTEIRLSENIVLMFYINFASYFTYVLFVLFLVIKYVPKKQ
jgi:hypothetical protein